MTFQARIERGAPLAIDTGKAQVTFTLTILIVSLVLQRFAIPLGQQQISVGVPIVAALGLWYVWTGALDFDRRRVAILFGLSALLMLSYSHAVNSPFGFVTKISLGSLIYFLILSSLAVLRFSEPMEEGLFFRTVTGVLAFIAICGIVEFAAQFVGLSLFTFSDFVPGQFSFEPSYNVVIPFGNGNHFKSNGLFLVEPSVFSQFMAIGLACEWVGPRRPLFVALFVFALFSAVAGTGWLAVGGFVAYIGLTSGSRGLMTAIGFTCVCVIAFAIVSFVLPDVAEMLTGRIDEFGVQGSSGNGRFVTPFMVSNYIFDLAPTAFLFGTGPGSSDTFSVISYVYGLSTPIKILLEYGIGALLAYLALLLTNTRTPNQTAVAVPAMIVFLFGGTYEHFPPLLFPVLLICTIANLRPSETAPLSARR
ncbi:MAG: hypothetical protein JOZ42_14745 [Acetobacteraceae bacterium]|nr:hypothetical protein [Acetobacteraceae bacterium]